LINQAIQGDMVTTAHTGDNPGWHQAPINGVSTTINVDYVQSFAFRDGLLYAVILFNLSLADTLTVNLQMPFVSAPHPVQYQIAPPSIHSDNEEAENVWIESSQLTGIGGNYSLDLPPHSLTVLTWSPMESLYLPFVTR
jgi:hypothetical protein